MHHLVLALVLGCLQSAFGATTNETGAAELYRNAFEAVSQLGDEDRQLLGTCGQDGCWVVQTPLGDQTSNLLVRQQHTIELARQAARMPGVDWGIGADMSKAMDVVNAAPKLSALLVLQARHELRDGQADQAIDDLLAAMTISRHVGSEPLMVMKLGELSAMRMPLEALASELPTLPADILADLPQRLERLPKSATPQDVIHGESRFAQQTAAAQGPAVMMMVGALKGFYETCAENAALAPDEFAAVVDAEIAKAGKNAWAGIIGPSMKRQRQTTAAYETKWAMLLSAIAIQRDGAEALKEWSDPYGDGPFDIRPTDSGFELHGDLTVRDKRITLRVGR